MSLNQALADADLVSDIFWISEGLLMLVLQSNKLHFAVATFDSSLAEANWRIIVTSFLLERYTVESGF